MSSQAESSQCSIIKEASDSDILHGNKLPTYNLPRKFRERTINTSAGYFRIPFIINMAKDTSTGPSRYDQIRMGNDAFSRRPLMIDIFL